MLWLVFWKIVPFWAPSPLILAIFLQISHLYSPKTLSILGSGVSILHVMVNPSTYTSQYSHVFRSLLSEVQKMLTTINCGLITILICQHSFTLRWRLQPNTFLSSLLTTFHRRIPLFLSPCSIQMHHHFLKQSNKHWSLQSPNFGDLWGHPILWISEPWGYPIPMWYMGSIPIPWYHGMEISYHIPLIPIPCHFIPYHWNDRGIPIPEQAIPSFQSCHRVSGVLFTKYEKYFCRL